MPRTGADPGIKQRGGRMASAEREPTTSVWGRSPSAPGQEVRGQSPLTEAESLWDFLRPKEGENLVPFNGFLGSFQSGSTE